MTPTPDEWWPSETEPIECPQLPPKEEDWPEKLLAFSRDLYYALGGAYFNKLFQWLRLLSGFVRFGLAVAAIGAVSLLTAFADPEWSVVDAQGFYIGLSISGALGFFASAYSLKLWRPWPTKRRIAVKDLERNELAQELGQKQKPPHWKYETGEWAANRSLATVAQVRAYFNTFCWNVFVLLFGSAVLMSFPGYFVSRYDSAEDIPAIMDELLDWLFIIIDIVDALG